jgi:hypothetical protein
MSWSKTVYSTMVQEISWDSDNSELVITYNNGSRYAYQGVDEGTALEGSKAPSVGQWVNTEIKGKYDYRKVG